MAAQVPASLTARLMLKGIMRKVHAAGEVLYYHNINKIKTKENIRAKTSLLREVFNSKGFDFIFCCFC